VSVRATGFGDWPAIEIAVREAIRKTPKPSTRVEADRLVLIAPTSLSNEP
jgi:hypothetical protein